MAHGEGVEHRQVPTLISLYHGESVDIPDDQVHGAFTPNQRALAAAIMLGRKDGLSYSTQAEQFLRDQRTVGMMSSPPDGLARNEIFAPAPHSVLWLLPMAAIGLWARGKFLQGAIVQWWADLFDLIGKFWTPHGLAAPCGRFKWQPGTPARPDWTLYNLSYARFNGLSEDGLGKSGDVTMSVVVDMLHAIGDAIRAATPDPVLAVQIGKWARDGGGDGSGYVAAFVGGRPPMNDPLGRVEVDESGVVVDAAKMPGEIPESGVVLIGRTPTGVAQAPAATQPPVTQTPQSQPPDPTPNPPDPTPNPPPIPSSGTPPPTARTRDSIAQDILRLQVAGKDRSTLREIAMEVTGAIRPWRTWGEVADDLLSLGPKHADVQRLAEDVRYLT